MEDVRVLEKMASRTMSDVVWKSQLSMCRGMPLSLSRNVFADLQQLQDWAMVLMLESHDIAKNIDQLTTDSHRDLADLLWDCNEANIQQESLKTRVYGLPMYGGHSRVN